jgi:hypothetical protein
MTEAPISLYFDVREGEHPNLEVVARTTIEWIEAIRDLASVVAPDLQFEIELIETEDGSLWLSNLIKAVKEGDRKALASIVGAVVVFFAMGPALHMQTDVGDAFWERLGHKHDVTIDAKDKAEIIAGVARAIDETQVEERRRSMLRYAETDPHITGIGVDSEPRKAGPVARIERYEFPAYAAPEEVRPTFKKDTEVRANVRVKIIRASLEENDLKPRWRFSDGDTKWSADIEDDEFIVALNSERTGIPLAVGQTLIVDVAIDRKFVDDAWQEDNRRVLRVREPSILRRQTSFDLGGD